MAIVLRRPTISTPSYFLSPRSADLGDVFRAHSYRLHDPPFDTLTMAPSDDCQALHVRFYHLCVSAALEWQMQADKLRCSRECDKMSIKVKGCFDSCVFRQSEQDEP